MLLPTANTILPSLISASFAILTGVKSSPGIFINAKSNLASLPNNIPFVGFTPLAVNLTYISLKSFIAEYEVSIRPSLLVITPETFLLGSSWLSNASALSPIVTIDGPTVSITFFVSELTKIPNLSSELFL